MGPPLPGTSEDLLLSLSHPERRVNPQMFHKPGPGQATPLELPMANMPLTSILVRGMGGACLHNGGSDQSSVTGPDTSGALRLGELESVDTEEDNKGVGLDKGQERSIPTLTAEFLSLFCRNHPTTHRLRKPSKCGRMKSTILPNTE